MYRSVIVILIASISVLLVSCEEPDTEAPTISIISPESGSIVSEGVSITCIATDNKGIKKVELWVDAVATAEIDDTEPFSLIWNTVEYLNESSHTISLRAYDLSGNKTDTEPISLTINQTDAFPTPVDITRLSVVRVNPVLWHNVSSSALTLICGMGLTHTVSLTTVPEHL